MDDILNVFGLTWSSKDSSLSCLVVRLSFAGIPSVTHRESTSLGIPNIHQTGVADLCFHSDSSHCHAEVGSGMHGSEWGSMYFLPWIYVVVGYNPAAESRLAFPEYGYSAKSAHC